MDDIGRRLVSSPYRPVAVQGGDPEGRRPRGPLGVLRDPWVAEKLCFVELAWNAARLRYVRAAVARSTSEDFTLTVGVLIDEVLASLDLVGEANTGDLAALGVGARGLPGTSVGLGLGSALGLRLLDALDVGFLTGPMVERLDRLDLKFQEALVEAWESGGFPLSIDGSARRMAEAVGIFFALLLEALINDLSRELAGAARGRLRPVLEDLRETRLFASSRGLDRWLLRNYDRMKDRFTAGADRVLDLASGARGRSSRQLQWPLSDISHTFQFREFSSDGKTHKQASGLLGVPGRVRTHRNPSAQRDVSAGTGDDAGHLIGDRFGAPGGPENLSPQNWVSNRYGTYKSLEDEWAEKLRSGFEIAVTVTDATRLGDDRPFVREVQWTELSPENIRSTHDLSFANTHTPRSREARGQEPTVAGPQSNNVIEVDFRNKTRLP